MANHKRPRTANHDPPPPTRKSSRVRTSTRQATLPPPSQAKSSRVRTSTRQATSSRPTRPTSARGKSSIIPAPTETPSITASGSHDTSDAGNSHGSSTTLNSIEFVTEVLKVVSNAASAELMILELMNKYSFSLPRLIELLRERNLEVSFSKVKYHDIAPKIGLDPGVEGSDIPEFEMHCARLPDSLFSGILDDLQNFSWQFGPLSKHDNERARALFLTGYFNKIVALFSGLLANTPEAMLEDKIATRMVYQFKTYGGVTVVFVEVKMDVGNLAERLNCYAQVIAECDACAWKNFHNGYHVPIMAILCYGDCFYFFKFEDGRQAGSAPRFFLGRSLNGCWRQRIAEQNSGCPDDARDFLRQTRSLCESLYYVFLSGYRAGLEAYWNRSVERIRESTPKWHIAKVSAEKALEEAKSAWNLRQENKYEESEVSADRALQFLVASVEEAPHRPRWLVPQLTNELDDLT